jgi:hypothetical protein
MNAGSPSYIMDHSRPLTREEKNAVAEAVAESAARFDARFDALHKSIDEKYERTKEKLEAIHKERLWIYCVDALVQMYANHARRTTTSTCSEMARLY